MYYIGTLHAPQTYPMIRMILEMPVLRASHGVVKHDAVKVEGRILLVPFAILEGAYDCV